MSLVLHEATDAMIAEGRNAIPDDVEKQLLLTHFVQPSRLSGVVHIIDVPLRPVASQMDSPIYKLTTFVFRTLRTLAANSKHFIGILKGTTVNENENESVSPT